MDFKSQENLQTDSEDNVHASVSTMSELAEKLSVSLGGEASGSLSASVGKRIAKCEHRCYEYAKVGLYH